MMGLLLWKDGEQGTRPVVLQECAVLQMRFLKAEIRRSDGTPEILLRRRITAAAGKLRRCGVTHVVLPEVFSHTAILGKKGVRPVSTLPLRRELASDWVRAALEQRSVPVNSARVAVSAEHLTGEVVRTVTELVLCHRYVLLELPWGGEELCRQLRREYGVSVLLNPPEEQLRSADAQVLFVPREGRGEGVALRLYEESCPLPRLLLPQEVEKQLPQGVNRGQLLTALRESGALRTGQITVAL